MQADSPVSNLEHMTTLKHSPNVFNKAKSSSKCVLCNVCPNKYTYNNWYHFNIAILIVTKHVKYQNSDAVEKCSNSHENEELRSRTVVSIQMFSGTGTVCSLTQIYIKILLVQSTIQNNNKVIL